MPGSREYETPMGGVMGRGGSRLRRREAVAEQVITAMPDRVWGLISDVEQAGLWWPRAAGGQIIHGEAEGREQVVKLDWGRVQGQIRQRVTKWQPGSRYGWRVVSEHAGDRKLTPIAETNVTVTITPEGGVSRVQILGLFEPVGARGGLAVRQLVKLQRKTYRKALKNLDGVLVTR